jgi:hypothetical protein
MSQLVITDTGGDLLIPKEQLEHLGLKPGD